MAQETEAELLEGIADDYGRCQEMLREVDLHWSGRPLVESVREAVDLIKMYRDARDIDNAGA